MSMERKERVQVIENDNYSRRQRVIEYAPETRQVVLSRISRLLWFIAGVIVALIAFRFILMLIAANPANGFVSFIYSVTNVLVAPFVGIVGTPAFETGSVVDMASLFAIVVYLLVTWAIVSLLRILFAGTRRQRQVTTVEREH